MCFLRRHSITSLEGAHAWHFFALDFRHSGWVFLRDCENPPLTCRGFDLSFFKTLSRPLFDICAILHRSVGRKGLSKPSGEYYETRKVRCFVLPSGKGWTGLDQGQLDPNINMYVLYGCARSNSNQNSYRASSFGAGGNPFSSFCNISCLRVPPPPGRPCFLLSSAFSMKLYRSRGIDYFFWRWTECCVLLCCWVYDPP